MGVSKSSQIWKKYHGLHGDGAEAQGMGLVHLTLPTEQWEGEKRLWQAE